MFNRTLVRAGGGDADQPDALGCGVQETEEAALERGDCKHEEESSAVGRWAGWVLAIRQAMLVC